MSVQQAEAFIARVQEDPDFAERLNALKDDPAAVQALVVAEGFDATPEEIFSVFLETFGSELSEEQLAAVAGGFDEATFVVVGGIVGSGLLFSGLAGAAIAASM
jgi:predicted ribosomally synthesized peptide with nif11-like leader